MPDYSNAGGNMTPGFRTHDNWFDNEVRKLWMALRGTKATEPEIPANPCEFVYEVDWRLGTPADWSLSADAFILPGTGLSAFGDPGVGLAEQTVWPGPDHITEASYVVAVNSVNSEYEFRPIDGSSDNYAQIRLNGGSVPGIGNVAIDDVGITGIEEGCQIDDVIDPMSGHNAVIGGRWSTELGLKLDVRSSIGTFTNTVAAVGSGEGFSPIDSGAYILIVGGGTYVVLTALAYCWVSDETMIAKINEFWDQIAAPI